MRPMASMAAQILAASALLDEALEHLEAGDMPALLVDLDESRDEIEGLILHIQSAMKTDVPSP